MTLQKRGEYWYGDTQLDLRGEIKRYSEKNGYVVTNGAEAICVCGNRTFRLQLDEESGVALRTCATCEHVHAIGDSAEFLDEAEPQERECVCEGDVFEITVGVALYEGSRDVKWLYLGCRCVACGLVGVYGDWKNEFNDYEKFLARV